MIGKGFRVSPKPGKTLLWIWVKKDLKSMKGQVGVDLAGGSMLNKPFFATENYISVDINKTKLDEGLARYPDAKVVNTTIQDYLNDPETERPDVLVCVQTMGTNQFFEHGETYSTIEQMYHALRPGGGMIFNIGDLGVDLNVIERRLTKLLDGKFKSVSSRFYGAFDYGGLKPRWERVTGGPVKRVAATQRPKLSRVHALLARFSFPIAFLMYLVPPFRTGFGLRKCKLYFRCTGKI